MMRRRRRLGKVTLMMTVMTMRCHFPLSSHHDDNDEDDDDDDDDSLNGEGNDDGVVPRPQQSPPSSPYVRTHATQATGFA